MLKEFDYYCLYKSCTLTTDPVSLTQLAKVADTALAHREVYEDVQRKAKVPWVAIAALHFRESNQSFAGHLHNGDPLTARTIHRPASRPQVGDPPFTWTNSAIDALSLVWKPRSFSIGAQLEFLERYNGVGYQKVKLNTPYLWDFTDKYTSGLFTSDGVLDPEKKESRPGCAALFKLFESRGISLDFTWLS